MDTKTCSLTEDEIRALIKVYANELTEDNIEDSLDRMTYLNRRLKAKPKDDKPEEQSKVETPPEPKVTTGW